MNYKICCYACSVLAKPCRQPELILVNSSNVLEGGLLLRLFLIKGRSKHHVGTVETCLIKNQTRLRNLNEEPTLNFQVGRWLFSLSSVKFAVGCWRGVLRISQIRCQPDLEDDPYSRSWMASGGYITKNRVVQQLPLGSLSLRKWRVRVSHKDCLPGESYKSW